MCCLYPPLCPYGLEQFTTVLYRVLLGRSSPNGPVQFHQLLVRGRRESDPLYVVVPFRDDGLPVLEPPVLPPVVGPGQYHIVIVCDQKETFCVSNTQNTYGSTVNLIETVGDRITL